MAQDDSITVDSQHYKVEFENEHIRVLRARYGPHEKSVMHVHPPQVIVALTDVHVSFAYPEGHTEEARFNKGGAAFVPATTHLPENLSDQPFEAVLIELKSS